jgi:hypothetical protein
VNILELHYVGSGYVAVDEVGLYKIFINEFLLDIFEMLKIDSEQLEDVMF